MIIKRGLADEAPRTLARWYASLRAKGNIALAGATIALVLLALGLTFVAGAFAYRQGLVSGYEKSVMRRLMHPVSYVRSFTAPTLPRLTVDMKLKHLRKVEAKREEAIQRGILFSSDDDYVPAQLRFDGRGIPVKMRLKGDTWPHFAGDKWSFRIKLNEDDRLFGMRRFSIQSPATRGYIDGWAALENFSHEGVLSPRLSFVNITFNGADKGIYALEEFFAKEMVEAQGRRSGVIVAFHEDIFWIRRDQLAVPASIRQELFHYENAVDPQDHRSRIIDTFASGAVQRDPALVKQRDEAIRLLRGFQQQTLRPSEIFDIRLLARYLAIVELWSAPHGTAPNNIRFYYNPISARLEPVGSEPGPGFRVDSDTASLFALETTWVREALEDPVVAGAYVEELRRVSSEEYLHELEAAIGKDLELSLVALHREWPQLTTPWGKLRARQEVLRATLRPPSLVQALHLPSGVEMNGPALGETNPSAIIHVANMFPLPTEVIGFKVDDGPLVAATDFLATSDLSRVQVAEGAVVLGARRPGESLSFAVFSGPVPAQGVSDQLEGASAIMVVNRLIGSDGLHETIAIPYTPIAVDTAIPQRADRG